MKTLAIINSFITSRIVKVLYILMAIIVAPKPCNPQPSRKQIAKNQAAADSNFLRPGEIGGGVRASVWLGAAIAISAVVAATAGAASGSRVWLVKTIAHNRFSVDWSGIAVDARGNAYVTSYNPALGAAAERILKISPKGTITTYAGGGSVVKDGVPATSVHLFQSAALAVDRQGNLYIAETSTSRSTSGWDVRKVSPDGTITTFAGGGVSREDGVPATSAYLGGEKYGDSLAFDRQGNLYVSDFSHVLKVTPGGIASTLAGFSDGRVGYGGDKGPANKTLLINPRGLAVDGKGNVFFVEGDEFSRDRIRKVSPDGMITTFAKGGGVSALVVDNQGRVYTQVGNGLTQFSADGKKATRIAGYGGSHPLRNGVAMGEPLGLMGLAIDGQGKIYVADSTNGLVRVLYLGTAPQKTSAPKRSVRAMRAVVMTVEADLLQLASGRAKLKAVLTNVSNCSLSPPTAAAQIAGVIANRQHGLDQLSRLATPTVQAARFTSHLREALAHSIAADRHYRSWLEPLKPSASCPPPRNEDYRSARREDTLATAAKRRFLAAFNPVARALGLRAWSANEF